MQFNSVAFLLFFPAVLVLYFALPHQWRWGLLLIASYYFYMAWKAEYALLMLFSTMLNYGIAIALESINHRVVRNVLLGVAVVCTLGLLFVFKYLGFFTLALQNALALFNISYQVPFLALLLPVGISFYTFQTMSYTIDVYRGTQRAERNLGIFALYVSFFPQLVAGPIERSTHLLPQFYAEHPLDYARITSGLRRMAWGFFKKMVVADKAALLVNAIYNHPTEQSGLMLLFATFLFSFQIYCDFSGYSDIAIGAARTLGFDLMENFRQPYLAQSLADFWRRWHISLSTWFRDYLYIPLGGSRVGRGHHYLNLLVVFIVSGLWHGANWTFLIWGMLHGLYLVLELVLQRPLMGMVTRLHLERLPRLLAGLRVFVVFHLVLLAWVFFRAGTVTDAFYILGKIATDSWQPTTALLARTFHVGTLTATVLAVSILLVEVTEYLQRKGHLQPRFCPLWMRWATYYVLVLFIVLFGELNAQGQFIYFQF
ncbi:MAG: MBOAT family protein [Caldilineaceae bacterium]|nr:MBOAT family protein [Caldilineaceae bacterium]